MGDFRGQKRPFLVLFENESNDFAENLSKVSSNGLATFIKLHHGLEKSGSRDMWHMPHIPDIPFHPLGQKKSKTLFLLFFYELSRSDFKKAIKIFWPDFSPYEVRQPDLEFFWKISKFLKSHVSYVMVIFLCNVILCYVIHVILCYVQKFKCKYWSWARHVWRYS